MDTTLTRFTVDEAISVGSVELTVADLDRSIAHYTEAIGLQLLAHGSRSAELGVPGRTLAVLREIPGAVPAPASSPGLSHFAPQVPSRADLARFAEHATDLGLEGDLRDHSNAQSCYVTDPDGHVVEVTWGSPREQWRRVDGRPVLVADPMDLQSLLEEPGADAPFTGLPAGTVMGHVQLKVTDAGLVGTEAFYRDALGLDVQGRLGGSFLALGFDDVAPLVLTNRFSQHDSAPAPAASAHLVGVDLLLSAPEDVQALAQHLAAVGHPHEVDAAVLSVRDPSGNLLRFTAGEG